MANQILLKRASGSDPSASDLTVGEIAIRTDNGKLFTKKDNGTVAEISGAGGGNNFFINSLSSSSGTGGGSASFNGSAYRFELSNPPSQSAQQLLVSINGVIQKPTSGTGQPSQGFAIDGNDIILSDAPATGSDFFIVTYASLAIAEPSDNTVTSAKIVDGTIVGSDLATNIDLVDNQKIRLGTGNDLHIYHDGTSSFIKDTAGASFNILATESIAIKTNNTKFSIACNKNGSVELYNDNSKKLETKSFGATITGSLEVTAHVYAPDNGKILLGNAQDFELFHDSSVSIIRSSSHPIAHYSNTRHHFLNADGSENMAVFTTNGACELYHDGTKRIFTEANGGAIGGTSRFLGHGNATGANATEVHFNSNSGHFGIHFSGHGNTGNTYTAARMVINGTGGTYGTITYSLSGTGYNSQSSDRRSKKNIVEWTESELDKFKNLQPKLFHFDHNINSDPKYKGYIAQDNLAAFPEAYPLVDDRYMFNPSGMVVYLMKAVQELAAKVEALEGK